MLFFAEISSPSMKKRNGGSVTTKKLFLTHKTETGAASQVRTLQIFGGKFKILIKLLPGINTFDFEFCRIYKSLSVLFDPPSDGWHPHRIGLVYVVCSDTDGSFQAPPGKRWVTTTTLPGPAQPCPTLPNPALLNPALPNPPCPTLPNPAQPCPTLPYLTLSCPTLLAQPCPASPCLLVVPILIYARRYDIQQNGTQQKDTLKTL
jgi:Putative peptidase family